MQNRHGVSPRFFSRFLPPLLIAAGAAAAAPAATAQNTASDRVSGTLRLACTLNAGSVTLNYEATLSAEVTPYVENDSDTASFTATVRVNTGRDENCTFGGLPPIANPQVYFGTGGAYNLIYGSATPYTSSVSLNRTGDAFLDGIYNVAGNDGAGAFALTFGVSVGPFGVGVSDSSGGPIILLGTDSPQRLTIGNVLWGAGTGLTSYRGNFRDGGSFTLSQVRLRPGTESQAEFGEVIIRIPAFKAREGVGVLTLTGEKIGDLDARVRYIRGNFLRQPSVEFSAERSVVRVGERVNVSATIFNRSTVTLNGGEVTIDTGGLRPFLFPLVGSQDFDRIPPNGRRTVTFELEAFSEGRAALNGEISGGWSSPVPPGRTYSDSLSIPGGILVSNSAPLPPLFSDGFEGP